MSWEQIAQVGYEQYAKILRASKRDCKAWDDLNLAERMAWVIATREMCYAYGRAVKG